MKIANIMFGGKRGGLEQALVDTSEALRLMGHDVTAIVRDGAAIIPQLTGNVEYINAPYAWNIFARKTLQRLLPQFDAILLHGNRASSMTRGLKKLPPIAVVAHSRFFKRPSHAKAIIALSESRARELGTQYVVPNLIRLPVFVPRNFGNPPIIGAMGRFSHEKGFDILLDALALLRDRGLTFRAVIAGTGALEPSLKAQATKLQLDTRITWAGWVNNPADFFRAIDIFCMSSRTESFPISLLEAMAHARAIVTTDCGGPSNILTDRATGIITPITAEGIANALEEVLNNPERSLSMGAAARLRAEETYALPVVAKKLDAVMRAIATIR